MNYDIKLYAHGVPKGQGTWGVSESDKIYIDSFYGRKSDVPVQMLVEIMNNGTGPNCYYTYYRKDNINDSQGRSGSYFALTIRINYYYADVQNMFNILDAAFNKFIIGSVLEKANGAYKYLVSDFSQSNQILIDLEQELKKYLMQFSSNSDFVILNGFVSSNLKTSKSINLLECEPISVAKYLKSNACISVSPFYPSLAELQMKDKMNEQIVAIREEYKEADKTIRLLNQDKNKSKEEINNLQNKISNLQVRLKDIKHYQADYDKVQGQLSQANKTLERVRKCLFEMREISECLDVSSPSNKRKDSEVSISSIMKNIMKFIPLVNLLLLIMVILGLAMLIYMYKGTPAASPTEIVVDTPSVFHEQQSKGATLDLSSHQTENSDVVLQEESEPLPSEISIDVQELTSTQTYMKLGTKYTVRLWNKSQRSEANHIKGRWSSDDFIIEQNKVTPSREGKCTISFEFASGEKMLTREIEVRK